MGAGDGLRPLAIGRAPSELEPEAVGSFPLTFPRLVQPVLDAKCVGCHEDGKMNRVPSLRGDRFGANGWSEAFLTLNKQAWGMSGGNGVALKERQFSIPGRDGARVSPLYRMLGRGHHEVKLSDEEMRRITLWLGCNSNFYGAYHDPEKQARKEIVKPRCGIPAWIELKRLCLPVAIQGHKTLGAACPPTVQKSTVVRCPAFFTNPGCQTAHRWLIFLPPQG
ncbi:MAG: hypothetical protein K9N23_18365 [Akkermansiaceae bacterium]|nr:hypothetical protein [Akkermansiaceae bacterium]